MDGPLCRRVCIVVKGFSPLHLALSSADIAPAVLGIAEALILGGARMDAVQHRERKTAMHLLAERGALPVSRLLDALRTSTTANGKFPI